MEEVETAEELLAKQQRKEKKDLQGKKTCHDCIYKYYKTNFPLKCHKMHFMTLYGLKNET